MTVSRIRALPGYTKPSRSGAATNSKPVSSDQFGDGPLKDRGPRLQPSESRMVRCWRTGLFLCSARAGPVGAGATHDMSERFAHLAMALNLPRARGPSVRETGRREQAGYPASAPRWHRRVGAADHRTGAVT